MTSLLFFEVTDQKVKRSGSENKKLGRKNSNDYQEVEEYEMTDV